FKLNIRPEMAMIDARVLPAPEISYHHSSEDDTFTPINGGWDLRGKKVVDGANLNRWCVVNFDDLLPINTVISFIHELNQTFIDIGLNMGNRHPPVIYADQQDNIDNVLLHAYFSGFTEDDETQLIVCILPNAEVPLYAEIKRVSDTILGIPTQCIKSEHVQWAKKGQMASMAQKINMKLDGINWFVNRSHISFISSKPTIVFGAHVIHPLSDDVVRPSIATLSASMDSFASSYASSIRAQDQSTAIIEDLTNMVKELLEEFYRCWGERPQQILFYRSGVSEGQFDQVLRNEVAAIHAACASLDRTYMPPVTFVVVQKQRRVRFFPVHDRDGIGKCQPGTVVDTDMVVTRDYVSRHLFRPPVKFGFYLQSHPDTQGTSRFTLYNVLHDENFMTDGTLQDLTYKLCYLSSTSTSAISICAPVYHATRLGKRASLYRDVENWDMTEVNPNLHWSMYYI
ncbi:Piwi domain-containing protein, partial [Halteromyces radiatus]|uniref:Piwi domain-containing protein n=1 Tax=Halteromyces radiatus TaxID=101107 RepID=UPI00222040AF